MDLTLEEVAQILSSVDLGASQMGEVYDAVSSSTGNGYDEEYTMKDLFVNLIGAVVFSVIGFISLKKDKSNKVTDNLMIKPNEH